MADMNSHQQNHTRATRLPKNAVPDTFDEKHCGNRNALDPVLQNVEPTRGGLPQWPNDAADENGCTSEERYEICYSSDEEQFDISGASLPDYVVKLYKFEENNGPEFIWENSLNDSQDSTILAWISRKNMYDYAEYSKDVYNYLKDAEMRHQPTATLMKNQEDIDFDIRSLLVDWLVEVAEEYGLENETLYLAVSLIDRFRSLNKVLRTQLQLLGTASMFVAQKYEEIRRLRCETFVFITADTCSKNQILEMEPLILTTVDFNVNVPTTFCFLQYICCATDVPKDVVLLAQYLCELTLLEAETFLKFLPSHIAAAAVVLSNYTFRYEAWDTELEQAAGHKLEDLSDVTDCLYATYRNSSRSCRQAIRGKYRAAKYNNVSSVRPPKELWL